LPAIFTNLGDDSYWGALLSFAAKFLAFAGGLEISMTVHQSPRPELCSAEYSATLVPVPDGFPKVFITAQGVHPTSGYEVMFHASPIDVFPPQFSLWHLKPSGLVTDVVTPFTRFTVFEATKEVKFVEITDAAGRHKADVKPLAGHP
jgi:hypothetical protein